MRELKGSAASPGPASVIVPLNRCNISLLTGNSFPQHTAAGSVSDPDGL